MNGCGIDAFDIEPAVAACEVAILLLYHDESWRDKLLVGSMLAGFEVESFDW
jgi:hypothetical protein